MNDNFLAEERAKELAEFYKNDACTKDLLKKRGLTPDDITWEIIIKAGITRNDQPSKLIIFFDKNKKSRESEEYQRKFEEAKRYFNVEYETYLSSPIKLLRLNYEFNRWVDRMRTKYEIKTDIFLAERRKLFNDKDDALFKKAYACLVGGIGILGYFQENEFEKIREGVATLKKWEEKLAPGLDWDIARTRFRRMRLPVKSDRILKSYILYGEELDSMSSFQGKFKPSAEIINNEHVDSHIYIKVYADTDKKEFDKFWDDKIKDMQKELKKISPIVLPQKDYEIFLRRKLWYELRKEGLSEDRANKELESLGLRVVNYAHDDSKVMLQFIKTLFK